MDSRLRGNDNRDLWLSIVNSLIIKKEKMSVSQIILLVLAALVVGFYLSRYLRLRSINQYTPAEAASKMKNSLNIVFLDVRSAQERKSGSIKGSLHLPLHELRFKINTLEKYKGKEIICYCRSGNRSLAAALILKKHGFNSASLTGGIGSWNLYTSQTRG
jgi:rhodanese-related sulfurtransferase